MYLLVFLLTIFLAVNGHDVTKLNVPIRGDNDELECPDTSKECQWICAGRRCGNEVFRGTDQTASVAEPQLLSVQCTTPESCIGQIKIVGKSSQAKPMFQRMVGKCDTCEACVGATFYFKKAKKASFFNDVKETTIIFDNVEKAVIELTEDEPVDDVEMPYQFQQNQVYVVDKKGFLEIEAVKKSVVSSFIDVQRSLPLEKPVKAVKVIKKNLILCVADESCIGNIIVTSVEAITTVLDCGPGSCNWVALIAKAGTYEATRKAEPFALIFEDEAIEYWTKLKSDLDAAYVPPVLFVVCEPGPDAPDAEVFATDWTKYTGCIQITPKMDDLAGLIDIHVFGTIPLMMVKVKALLEAEASDIKWPDEIKLRRPWLLKKENVPKLAGIFFEGALGTVLVGASTAGTIAALGAMGVASAAAIFAGVAVGTIVWPLAIAGVIALSIWGGIKGYSWYRKNKQRKKFADWTAAHENEDNMYDDDEREFRYDDGLTGLDLFEYDFNGNRIKHDLFGEGLFDEIVNDLNDNSGSNNKNDKALSGVNIANMGVNGHLGGVISEFDAINGGNGGGGGSDDFAMGIMAGAGVTILSVLCVIGFILSGFCGFYVISKFVKKGKHSFDEVDDDE